MGEKNYQVRWNIQRKDVLAENGDTIERWEYDYNSKHPATEVTRKAVLTSIIREKFDIDDEISLAMKREDDAVKFADHESWVVFAKTTADQIMSDYAPIQ